MIAAALKDSEACPLLLEQTAGHQGLLGRDFDQTAELIELAGGGERLGLCLDSCHLFVQGYDITDEAGLALVLDEGRQEDRASSAWAAFTSTTPPRRLAPAAIATPTSAAARWARRGLAAFLSEPRFEGLPATLETPGPNKKGPDRSEVETARRLRRAGLKRHG